jgi:hypothetical protein
MDREKRETAFAEQYLKLRGPTIKCKDALEVVQNMGYTKTLVLNFLIFCELQD